jgi:hypothetical protein
VLLIAEAPPAALDRYFYFPKVWAHDSLFREVARAFGFEPTRDDKRELLGKLRAKGVFLIDAQLEPIEEQLAIDLRRLRTRVRRLEPRRIIVLKASVYDALYEALRASELPVIGERVPFPGSGQQRNFHAAMRRALRRRPPRFTGATREGQAG